MVFTIHITIKKHEQFACAFLVVFEDMNTNIVATSGTGRKKKDGTCSVILRLEHNHQTKAISVEIGINRKDWEERKHLIKKMIELLLIIFVFKTRKKFGN